MENRITIKQKCDIKLVKIDSEMGFYYEVIVGNSIHSTKNLDDALNKYSNFCYKYKGL